MDNNIVEETNQICKGGSKKGTIAVVATLAVGAIGGIVAGLLYKKRKNEVEVESVDVDCDEANIEE